MTPMLACVTKNVAAQTAPAVGTTVMVIVEPSIATSARCTEQKGVRATILRKLCESGAGGRTSSASTEPQQAERRRAKSVRRIECLYSIYWEENAVICWVSLSVTMTRPPRPFRRRDADERERAGE